MDYLSLQERKEITYETIFSHGKKEQMILFYYLEEYPAGLGFPLQYGILVLKQNANKKETAKTGPLFTNRKNAILFLEQLARCNVTPLVLNEVVAERLNNPSSSCKKLVDAI